jgi:hypothetical protein
MPVDEQKRDYWEVNIRNSLDYLLWQQVRQGGYLQEFMMAGKKPNKLKSSIVVSVGNKEARKQVQKECRAQSWLTEDLKSRQLHLIVVVDPAKLTSRLQTHPTDHATLSLAAQVVLSDDTTSFCGQTIRFLETDLSKQSQRTLGGLISVNGVLYGLTAGHGLESTLISRAEDPIQIGAEPEHNVAQSIAGDNVSDSAFVFEDEDDSSGVSRSSEGTSNGSGSLRDYAISSHQNIDAGPFANISPGEHSTRTFQALITAPSFPETGGLQAEPITRDCDWALVEIPNDGMVLPNSMKGVGQLNETFIESTILDDRAAKGNVTIITASRRLKTGVLSPSPASFGIGRFILDVRLITLQQPLSE